MLVLVSKVVIAFALISTSLCKRPNIVEKAMFQPLTKSSLVPSSLQLSPQWKRMTTPNSTEEKELCQCATLAVDIVALGPPINNLVEASLALMAQFQLNCVYLISPKRLPVVLPVQRPSELYATAQVEKMESFFQSLMEEVERAMAPVALPSHSDEQLTLLLWNTVKSVCARSIPRSM